MITASISVVDNATPAIGRVSSFLSGDAAKRVIAYSARNTVRGYLGQLDTERPNRIGGRRTHYWSGARRSTNYTVDPDGATITIAEIGMPLHYHGGTVTAGASGSSVGGKMTRYLTVPARPEAHGRKASDFNDLVMLWGKNGPYALARSIRSVIAITRSHTLAMKAAGAMPILGVKEKGLAGGEVMFWLKKSVTIAPDPTVIPSNEEIGGRIINDLSYAVGKRFEGTTLREDESVLGGEGI